MYSFMRNSIILFKIIDTVGGKSGDPEHLIPEFIEHIIPNKLVHLNPEHKHHNIKARG